MTSVALFLLVWPKPDYKPLFFGNKLVAWIRQSLLDFESAAQTAWITLFSACLVPGTKALGKGGVCQVLWTRPPLSRVTCQSLCPRGSLDGCSGPSGKRKEQEEKAGEAAHAHAEQDFGACKTRTGPWPRAPVFWQRQALKRSPKETPPGNIC